MSSVWIQTFPRTYKYSPLSDKNEIRVLEILPTGGSIECRIRHTTYDTQDYHALSYVWGRPMARTSAVIVDDAGVSIGRLPLNQNLMNAMNEIKISTIRNKYFWIDQVCINQMDLEERGQQVGLMGEIYSHAQKVITYAGPEHREAHEQGMRLTERLQLLYPENHVVFKALYSAATLNDASRELQSRMDQFREIPPDLRFSGGNSRDDEAQYERQGWEWLMNVVLGKWTQRLWIVQEHMLNSEGTILKGGRLLSWQHLIGLLFLLYHKILPSEPFSIFCTRRYNSYRRYDDVSATLVSLHSIWTRRRLEQASSFIGGQRYASLIQNIATFYRLQCKDSRDRVYALIAMSNDVNQQRGRSLTIRPDYSNATTPSVLSHRLSVAWIQGGQCFKILPFSCKWQKRSSLPSWSINIDLPHSAWTPDSLRFDQWIPHPGIQPTRQPQLINNYSNLVCKGSVVDYIAQTSRELTLQHYGNALFDILPTMLEFYDELLELVGPDINIEKMAMLCHTLSPHSWQQAAHPMLSDEQNSVADFYYFFTYSLRWLRTASSDENAVSKTLLTRLRRTKTSLSALFPPDYLQSEPQTQEQRLSSIESFTRDAIVVGRSFCWSKGGRLCNVMHQAHVGDAIVALEGAGRMYVIREVESGRYLLIGDAYVDGLMQGEAYAGVDPEDVDHDIVLV